MDVFDLAAKLSLDTSEYNNGLNTAENEANSFSSKLGTVAKTGGAALAALGTATIATGAAFVKGAGDVASYGDNIDKMSQKMGISAQAYQEWDAVLQHSGTSIDSMSRGMQTLQKNAVNSADKFAQLGISQEQLASMSTEELFSATIEGLQNMGEGAERTALASELLGGSAKELGALLNTSAADTQAMKDRVHELGGVMSDEAVKNAAAFQDQLQDMQTGFQSLSRNLLSDFMPSLTTVMSGLTDIFSGDEGGISKVSEGIDTLINGITNALPNLLNIGSQIVMSIGTAITNNLPKLLTTGADVILTLTKSFIQNLPQIVKSGMEAIISLAKGIAEALPDLIPAVVDAVLTIVDVLLDNIDLLIDAGIELTIGLTEGLIEALPILIEKAPMIIEKLVTAIIRNAPKIAKAGIDIIKMLGEGIVKAFPTLIKQVPKLIDTLFNALIGAVAVIVKIGVYIVQGIWEGIVSATDWLKKKITGWVDNVVDFLKKLFKIASPSKLMRDEIGKYLAMGVYEGWEDEDPIGKINDDINALTRGVSVTAGYNLNSNGSDSLIDYDSMANAFLYAMEKSGFTVELNDREMGRLVRKVVTV